MKKNGLIFSIVLVATIALAFVLRFAVSTPEEDFIISVDNYSGRESSEITVSNDGKVIATIPALKNETTKEVQIPPFDLKSPEFIISYIDKNGKKHDDNRFEVTSTKSTMNNSLYMSVTEVKDDGTMNIDYSYSSTNGEEISSQTN
ncbi:hypothetical protein [Listeria booriae]|uniref:Uncharacterized protein n=1 Tax=Listeria booriae TaxID=1552123 RepID=A0A7X0TKW8_9LIST|nr:hypothetical protein [Listeria booriae]MBC1226234.1 hypothetical protein [Listeria booriae]MBC1228954.1 hypothetical protein [Listeria booriae]MBC1232934.1 hypothetical protein [Listeria booriae]MBC1245552.1 hypothetical protein [Listeria booriae]MBC1306703.1 hypothetical protein [Listeria booriae]